VTGIRDELADLRSQLTGVGVALGWGAVKAVPGPLTSHWFRAAADSATIRNGPGVRQLRLNLRRVVGQRPTEWQMDSLVGDAMRSYARYWLETFRLPKMNKRAVVQSVDRNTVGVQYLDAAVESGRGYVVALPHTGNYDVAGLWVVDRHGKPFTTVAERLKPEALFDRFVAYRQSLGMEVLALTGGDRPPTAVLTERLHAGGGVCLVADRDLSRGGIEVDFFGERARMPGGPAMLAATTGAALIPVGLWFTPDGGWGQRICRPIELPEGRLRDKVELGTQLLADEFARLVAAHPADWHMVQKLWLADLSARPTRTH
jgi:phosphatidylinositol dimannoside acyltransferase